MNDIAQYMQETGIGARDFDELDEYEVYLHYKTEYKFLGVVLTRDEWEAMAEQYKIVMNDIAIQRERIQTGGKKPVGEAIGAWWTLHNLEALANDLERQLGW